MKRLIDVLEFRLTEFTPIDVRGMKPNDPTPNEIEERMAEIRAEWSPFIRSRRRVVQNRAVEVTRVDTRHADIGIPVDCEW